MKKPEISAVPDFYQNYIRSIPDEELVQLLRNIQEAYNHLGRLSNEEAEYRYADGKWSIKELTGHLIDTERIFCSRALRFSRSDNTELPGFDQDLFVENSHANNRDWGSILNEYDAVRSSTIYLFESFTEDQLNLTGNANSYEFSVSTLGYIIAGHQKHHLNIIQERYLSK